MIYLLTPTGGRAEGLALLGEYLDAQTYTGLAKWIVVEDVDPASRIPQTRFETEVIRPAWRWQPGMNTQAKCLLAGLELVPDGSTILILEDDDAYLPNYLQATVEAMHTADLVGEAPSRYYNVATSRWRVMGSRGHASLACTALRGPAVALLREVCKGGSRRIDMDLWQKFRGAKRLLDTQNTIGIKGLPGRAGIGVGHRSNFGDPDTTGILRRWLGDYADNYEIFRRAA